MSNHITILLLGFTLCLTLLPSCQPLPDPDNNRFGGNRSPIVVTPTVRTEGAELFARNPFEEFQVTGSNPAPIRSLSAGETLTILQQDGRFTKVRLMDGTVGYIVSSDISQGSSGQPSGYRVPDQDGNRFGGGNRTPVNTPPTDPTDPQPIDPITPNGPTTTEPDVIDLDDL